MEEDDPPPREKEVDDTVDVGPALLAQLPEVTLEMADEWLTGLNVAETQLVHRPAESRSCLVVERVEELFNRAPATLIDVELECPVSAALHIYAF
jgi:hypothetical protein